jgi:Crp-like helix-turn-helix domain
LHNAQRRTAITGLPRVEQRLLALFWQLADRWGVVRPEGIVIRLQLTHQFLGHLIAAKRPTVSLALAGLAADELLTRDDAAHWTLSPRSVEALQSDLVTWPSPIMDDQVIRARLGAPRSSGCTPHVAASRAIGPDQVAGGERLEGTRIARDGLPRQDL